MEFVSRIINLVPDTINTIEDALKVMQEKLFDNTIGIIKENFNNLKEAFLNVEWYYHLGFALWLATVSWVSANLISQPFLAY